METPAPDGNGTAAGAPAVPPAAVPPPQMNGTTTHTDGTVTAAASAVPSAPALSAVAGSGEQCLSEMNGAFAKCLSLVCPPIQYPPHCRFNPVQQDAADMAEIEARLEEFFLHAKQIELLFLRDANGHGQEPRDHDEAKNTSQREPRHELELEILNLENELNEKNDLIEKYADVIRGWEGKFKRLDHRLAPERD